MMGFNKRKMKALKVNQEGFVILEGMISAAIVGIFMTSVVYLMWGAVKANIQAGKISEALSLGADVVEQMALLPSDDADIVGNSYTVPNFKKKDKFDNEYDAYWFTVTTAVGATYEDSIDVEVMVRWRDPDGRVIVDGLRFNKVIIRDII